MQSEKFKVPWDKRDYRPDDFEGGTVVDRHQLMLIRLGV